ncbi:hypothetical protein ISN44_As05g030060 [Arabidopsis suecica]|uniref:Uncharacterized protein n=1 Tax=Arabidopsis suecica TaxID=45249 RepID=A0A8T2DHJ7_ARASU|nr:hypothetical protein ISN44_As05g030060 [Arabidopsis suecica]
MENLGHRFLMSTDANYFGRLKSLAHDNVYKEEGASSIGGTQKKIWEEKNSFPNAEFRVEAVSMFNLCGLNKKQFALASRFIKHGTVMNKLMIETSSVPPVEKFYIEAAVAKLMELPKGNENLSIGYF